MDEKNAIPYSATLRALLIDDDIKLAKLVSEYLRREGIDIEAAHDGENGLQRAQNGQFDILILDVMLPGIGGFEVLRRLRASNESAAHLPVLMLSARVEEVDRVLGLELGADDYLSKPFSSRELVARLRAILRRWRAIPPEGTRLQSAVAQPDDKIIRVGDVELDGAAREVHCNNRLLDLTSGEFDILEVLMNNAGEIVTRDAIAKAALGRPLTPYDRSIDVHIYNLRRKLGPDAENGERIKSVRGMGYLYSRHRRR